MLAAITMLAGLQAPSAAEPKVERKVKCVYPGEALGSALTDFATQLGFAFVAGEFEDSLELDELIWVHARGVSPDVAATLIGASGGVRVKLDEGNRRVTLEAEDVEQAEAAHVRAFKADALCTQFLEYQKRYGQPAQETAEAGSEYRPTASEELRDAVAEILQLEGAPGSAIGKRLLYTRGEGELGRIAELLKLLETEGESEALRLTREHRTRLSAMKSDFNGDETLLSAVLWHIFKDCEMPVFFDRGLIESLDLQYDTTAVSVTGEQTHYDTLLALAREQGFWVDSRHGAMRLHEDAFEGASGYRVFNVADLLAELEKDYAALKTADSLEGFEGDLRSEGGVQVIVDALALQLENAGYAPLIRAYGSRIVIVGGVEIVDRAWEVLTAIGWTQEKK